MKKGEIVFILIIFIFFSSGVIIADTQCNNGIDDEGDGKTDALINLEDNNKETLRVNTDPFGDISTSAIDGVMEAVAKSISNKNMPYSLRWMTSHAVLRKQGSVIHTATLNKVCNILGYASVKTHSCVSPSYENRCNFDTPGNNYMWIFDSTINNFKAIGASDNEWISDITCETRLSACNDGINNLDGDTLIDYCIPDGSNRNTCDPGCASTNDNSEKEHDPECSDVNDNNEGPDQLICNNGIDDDNDGKVDLVDKGCCNADDNNEEGNSQCTNGCDDDKDGKVDYPEDNQCSDENDDIEGVITIFEGAYWANMLDVQINEADLKDSVKLVVGGQELKNKNIQYEIYKEVSWWFDSKIAEVDRQGVYVWKAGLKKDSGEFFEGNYYFMAKTDNLVIDSRNLNNGNNPYGILKVGKEENDLPRAIISFPENKQIYFKNEILKFTAVLSDVDDELIHYKWILDESDTIRENRNVKSGELISFDKVYSISGQKNTVLELEDGRENGINRFSTSILIINSYYPTTFKEKYIFSYIDIPDWGKFISNRIVDFNAASTYAIEGSYNIEAIDNKLIINCLNGLCPIQTKGCPVISNNLQPECRIALSNVKDISHADYSNINFNWKFRYQGPDNYNYENSCLGVGNSNIESECDVSFTRFFPRPGRYLAELTSSINPSSSFSTVFETSFKDERPQCLIAENHPILKKDDPYWLLTGNNLVSSSKDCFKLDGIDYLTGEPNQNCCNEALGYQCQEVNGKHECVFSGVDSCNDYKTKPECDEGGGHSNLAKREIETTEVGKCGIINEIPFKDLCTYKVSCKCVWNEVWNENKCKAIATSVYEKLSPVKKTWEVTSLNDPDKAEVNSECKISTDKIKGGECRIDKLEIIDECGPGIKNRVLKVFVSFIGDNTESDYGLTCENKEFEEPCINIVKLTFFTVWNLFVVILIILLIYYFYMKKKKNVKNNFNKYNRKNRRKK